MKEVINEITQKFNVSKEQFKTAVDMLCAKGIPNGCFDTAALCAVLEVLSAAERAIEE